MIISPSHSLSVITTWGAGRTLNRSNQRKLVCVFLNFLTIKRVFKRQHIGEKFPLTSPSAARLATVLPFVDPHLRDAIAAVAHQHGPQGAAHLRSPL